MLAILLTIIESSHGQTCADGEFWYTDSSCELCSSFIEHCSVCKSGDWSEMINGSFEEPAMTVASGAQKYNDIPGWTHNRDKIEYRNNQTPYDGNQYLDTTDVTYQNISQTITTQANFFYRVEFAYTPRTGMSEASNTVYIRWNDRIALTLAEDGTSNTDNIWSLQSITVQASGPTSTFTFESGGPDDTSNAFVDGVSYKNLPSCSQCASGYFLESNSCSSCGQHCSVCASSSVCASCHEGFNLADGVCNCPLYCLSCTDSGACTNCEATFEIFGKGCGCPVYYLLDSENGVCFYQPLVATVTKNESFYLLSFSEDLNDSLMQVDLESMFLPGNDIFSFNISALSSSEYELRTQEEPEGSSLIFLKINNAVGKTGSILKEDSFELTLLEASRDQNSEEVPDEASQGEDIGDFLGVDSSVACISSIVAGFVAATGVSIISSNANALWSFMNMSIMIYYLPLQNTGMPLSLRKICEKFDSDLFGLIPNLGKLLSIQERSYPAAPTHWKVYGISTPSFVLNAGNMLFTILCSLLAYPVLQVLRLCMRKKDWLIKRIGDFKWCFFLRLSLQSSIELAATSILCANSIFTEGVDTERLICVAVLFFQVLFVFQCVYLVIRYRHSAEDVIGKYGTYFEEFKNGSVVYLLYYPLFYLQRGFYAVGINFLEDFSGLQVSINIFLSVLMISYLIFARPFRNKEDFVSMLASEGILCMLFVLSCLCLRDISSETASVFGQLIIGGVLSIVIINFIIFGFVLIKFLRKRKKIDNIEEDPVIILPRIRMERYKKGEVTIIQNLKDDNCLLEESDLFRKSLKARNDKILSINEQKYDDHRCVKRSLTEKNIDQFEEEDNYYLRRKPRNLNELLGHRRIDSSNEDSRY